MIQRAEIVGIELTRRCNMRCAHCMRGDPQSIDLQEQPLAAFLRQIRTIGLLVLSGGEPSLAAAQIKMVHSYLRKFEVDVFRVDIVTNAKVISKAFTAALSLFREPCRCKLAYGGDLHEDVPAESIRKLKDALGHQWEIKPQGTSRPLIKQGRCLEGREVNLTSRFQVCNGMIYHRPLYLNALGFVLPHTDLSYENQERNVLCRADDDILSAVETYKEEVT